MKKIKYNTYNKRIIKTKRWSSGSLPDWTNLWQDFSRKKTKICESRDEKDISTNIIDKIL